MRGVRGLGDVMDPTVRRTLQQWAHIGRRSWIVKPDWQVPVIAGLESEQQMLEEHVLVRYWQMLADFSELLKKTTLRVQEPSWLQPPYGSEPEDIVSESGVLTENGTPVTVISYETPDKMVATFPRFGHMLADFTQWGTVLWAIEVDGKPVRSYNNFLQQRGTLVDPTYMAKPITLKPKSTLTVQATGGAVTTTAYARMPGWLVPVTSYTQDGSQLDWNVR